MKKNSTLSPNISKLHGEVLNAKQTAGYDVSDFIGGCSEITGMKLLRHEENVLIRNLLGWVQESIGVVKPKQLLIKMKSSDLVLKKYLDILTQYIANETNPTVLIEAIGNTLHADLQLYNYFVSVGFANWFKQFASDEFITPAAQFITACLNNSNIQYSWDLLANLTCHSHCFAKNFRERAFRLVTQKPFTAGLVFQAFCEAVRFLSAQVLDLWFTALKISSDRTAVTIAQKVILKMMRMWKGTPEFMGNADLGKVIVEFEKFDVTKYNEDLACVAKQICTHHGHGVAPMKIGPLVYDSYKTLVTELDKVLVIDIVKNIISHDVQVWRPILKQDPSDLLVGAVRKSDETHLQMAFTLICNRATPLSDPPKIEKKTDGPLNEGLYKKWLSLNRTARAEGLDIMELLMSQTDEQIIEFGLNMLKNEYDNNNEIRRVMTGWMDPFKLLEDDMKEVQSQVEAVRRFMSYDLPRKIDNPLKLFGSLITELAEYNASISTKASSRSRKWEKIKAHLKTIEKSFAVPFELSLEQFTCFMREVSLNAAAVDTTNISLRMISHIMYGIGPSLMNITDKKLPYRYTPVASNDVQNDIAELAQLTQAESNMIVHLLREFLSTDTVSAIARISMIVQYITIFCTTYHEMLTDPTRPDRKVIGRDAVLLDSRQILFYFLSILADAREGDMGVSMERFTPVANDFATKLVSLSELLRKYPFTSEQRKAYETLESWILPIAE